MANRIIIYKDMTLHAKLPYRLADVFPTLDGHRTRLSSHCFASFEEAKAFAMAIEAREE
jgi:hypothetical protein